MNRDSDERAFRIGLTADFYSPDGQPKFQDMGVAVLDSQPHIHHAPLGEHRPQVEPEQIAGFHALLVLTPAVTARTVEAAEDLLAIARFGVGYDAVDVRACTEAGVVVCITTGAVDRSVAEATVGWMIAMAHHVVVKDRLVRTGQWHERARYMGRELRDRTFGTIGLGGIARETIQLLAPFGMKPPIAHDPLVDPAAAAAIGVRLTGLDELLAEADFVSIHCPLNDQTRGMIGRPQLARMKSSAYLINTARGGIIDELALLEALAERRIAGAALDCFAGEPVTSPSKFADLDNVLLAPHSIAWTDELFRDIGRMACQQLVDLSLGRRPPGVVNAEVFERGRFQDKWRRVVRGPALQTTHGRSP